MKDLIIGVQDQSTDLFDESEYRYYYAKTMQDHSRMFHESMLRHCITTSIIPNTVLYYKPLRCTCVNVLMIHRSIMANLLLTEIFFIHQDK